ncbi:MAG: NAD-dependent epimerase/dehydratase family protein [Candidatus Dormiibacterota bacterium]
MEILITGGNGLLGRHLVPELQARGDRVSVLALPGEDTSWLEARDARVFSGDIRQPETLAAPMRGMEAVLHLAGMMGVWLPIAEYRAVNVAGTENVARAALAEGVRRVVHVSSWTVYGMNLGHPVGEEAAFAPFPEPYALTKAEGDRLVQRMVERDHLPAVIVRPGTFFGPGDQLHFGRMADRVISGRGLIVGSGRNALPFVYVSDVVQGLLRALDQPQALGRAYNIANDSPLSQLEFLRAIAEEVGARPPWVHAPYRALYAVGSAAERLAGWTGTKRQPPLTRLGVVLFGTDNRHAIARARQELGFRPLVPLREGVRLAAAWYLQKRSPAPPPSPSGLPSGERPASPTTSDAVRPRAGVPGR